MIKSLKNKKGSYVFILCDVVKIPQWGINMDYTTEHSIPFLFGKDRQNKEFVILGKKGGAHNDLIWSNRKVLSKKSSLERSDYLLGRIWFVYSYDEEVPLGLVTFWEGECSFDYTNAKTIKTLASLLKEKRIDISEFDISIESKDGGYFIPVNEYISLGLSNTHEIPAAYERQKRKKQSISSHISDRWKDWDIYNNGTGYLGYHLMTRVEENNTKKNIKEMKKSPRILNENQLAQLVYECTMEYINSTPELNRKLQEKKQKNKKALMESKQKSQGITYNMLFEMVKRTVKTLLK